jgi:hypothetical protein
MKTTLLTALVLLAATPAWAGGLWCQGTVTVGPEWIAVEDANNKFLIKTNSPLGKRFLKVCPAGSECNVALGDNDDWNKRHTRQDSDGNIIITKWPKDGVGRQ